MRDLDRFCIRLGLVCCFLFAAGEVARAQFRIIGPAPVSPAVARQRIRALLEKVNAANLQETNKALNGLINWYRDLLDEEIVAAWQREGRSNLAPIVEAWIDARVAAGIVDYSWRERQVIFVPANEPVLELMMTRYPDTAKNFFEDLLGPGGRPPVALSQAGAETVCRILLDLPDIRNFRSNALSILPRYRQTAEGLLDLDASADNRQKNDRARQWRADLTASDPGWNAQRPAEAAALTGQFSTDTAGRVALDLFNAKQYAAAKDRATAGAASGSALSMYVLGKLASAANGGAENDIEAAKWFRKAADARFSGAMVELGNLYKSGRGVDQDLVEAARWYRLAAEAGDAAGMAALGRMYEIGGGVEQDYVQASSWRLKAAEAGSAAAMVELGLMYEHGHAIDAFGKPGRQDYGESMTWYAKSASAGDATGMYRLALSYETGKGTPPNRNLAMEWYRRAAAAGAEPAQARLRQNAGGESADAGASAAPNADELLKAARRAASQPLNSLPGFTARRVTSRFTAHRDRKWKSAGTGRVDLTFQNGHESFRNWAVDGGQPTHGIIVGVSVTQIYTMLAGLMAANTKASFRNPRPETIRNRETTRYDVSVELLTSNWMVNAGEEFDRAAYTGSVWIDRESRAAVRVEMIAHDLASDFPLDSAEMEFDYDLVAIGGRNVPMPVHVEKVTCTRATGDCTRDVDAFEYSAPSPAAARTADGVAPPVPVYRVQPDYSDEAKRARRSGVVQLSCVVDTQGIPYDIQVVESLGMGLDEKAIEALQKWRFRPGMKNGQPIEVRTRVEMKFQVQ